MHLISIILVLISALAHAELSLLIKKSKDKQIFCWAYHLVAIVIFLPVPFYYHSVSQLTASNFSLLLLLVGFLHYVYIFTFAKSFESGDLSLVYPIIRSSPAAVLVGSVLFLGEKVSVVGGVGVLLTVLGVYVLCMRNFQVRSILSPLTESFKDSSTRFALLTALIATAFTLIDKVFVDKLAPALYSYFLYVMITAGMSVQISLTRSKKAIWSEIRHSFVPILWCALLDVAGYSLVLFAFKMENISYVLALRQVSIIIAVAMGGLVLKEGNVKQRAVASGTIFVGILFVSFA